MLLNIAEHRDLHSTRVAVYPRNIGRVMFAWLWERFAEVIIMCLISFCFCKFCKTTQFFT